MPTMTGYEFGDVVLVPFPFTDLTAAKRRPAVVVSSPAYNRRRQDLVILGITSQVTERRGLGEAGIREWKEAGLLKPSVLKPVVTTIDKNLVLRQLGRLTAPDRQRLRAVLDTILGS